MAFSTKKQTFLCLFLCFSLFLVDVTGFLLPSMTLNPQRKLKKNLQRDILRSDSKGNKGLFAKEAKDLSTNTMDIVQRTSLSPSWISSVIPRFSICCSLLLSFFTFVSPSLVSAADEAETGQSFKIKKGAASTLNQGIVKTITRGVTLDNSDFSNTNLSGVSFQQSLIRNGKFMGANLRSASFFDADLTGADFTGADMSLCNLELANLKDAILRDAVVTEAYISGATRLTNIDITGADFTDTLLRSDQQKALCKKASGVNSITGVATADSLLCN